MSSHLPPRPSLEYLRKEAKELLHEMRRGDPDALLADAQYALARRYGFASWPKLKAHVEAASAASPFVGTWVADVARSRRHPANPFRRATLRVDVAGDRVTIADVVVDEAGRETAGEHTVHADGVARAQGGGYALTATWRGEHALETVATRDGAVVGRGTYEVSGDGRTLVVSSDEQRIVLERA
jgi:hypothetical protein